MEKYSEHNNDITDAILAFDTLYTTNHMKILKLLLPYLEPEHQKKLAVFIKWQELMFTLNFFQRYSASLYSPDFTQKKKLDFSTLLPVLSPYCSENEKILLSQFSNMQSIMKTIDGMQEYLPFIQQLFSSLSGEKDTENPLSSENINITDFIKNIMTEEQQAMFSMFMDKNL